MWKTGVTIKHIQFILLKSGFLVLCRLISPLPSSLGKINCICMPEPSHTIIFTFEKIFMHYHDDKGKRFSL